MDEKNGQFPKFQGWVEGYGAFTYAYRGKNMIIRYIMKQEEHHKRKTFLQEYRELLEQFGLKYDEEI